MLHKFKIIKGGGVGLILLFILQSVCLSAGTIQMLGGTDKSVSGYSPAGLLPVGCVVQFLTANTPPNDTGPNHISSGTTARANGVIGGGEPVPTGAPGTFNYFVSYNGNAYVRIWDTNNIAGSVRGKHYHTTSSLNLPGPPSTPPTYNLNSFRTDYVADAPPKPKLVATNFKLDWVSARSDYLVKFDLVASPNNSEYLAEVTEYQIAVKKQGDTDWKISRVGQTLSITEDPSDPYFTAGEWYVAVAKATNYFGTKDWSDPYDFQIPPGGGGGAAGPVTYGLHRTEGGIGLNAVAVLHTVPFKVEGTAVNNIKELIDAINTKSGAGNTVTTIGWLETASSDIKGWYITYDESGTATFNPTGGVSADPTTVALERGKSYQISVLRDVEVTFSQ